jgi:hypothetical protein
MLTCVATNDDKLESIKNDARKIKSAGEITLKVFRSSEATKSKGRGNTKLKGFEFKLVHEKALKGQATSHSTM